MKKCSLCDGEMQTVFIGRSYVWECKECGSDGVKHGKAYYRKKAQDEANKKGHLDASIGYGNDPRIDS